MHRRSWWIKYFISYLVVGMLPVVLGFIFYYTNVTVIKREIENANFSALSQACKEFDYILGEMKNITYHFSDYLLDFNEFPQIDSYSIADKNTLCQRLKVYEETFNIPVRIVLYFRGDTHVFTSEKVTSYEDFETSIRESGDLTMSRFFTQINSIRNNTSLRLSHNFFDPRKMAAETVYLFPLPYMDMIPAATICFMFKSGTIQKILENYLGELKGNIFIYNEMLNSLFNYESLGLSPENIRSFITQKGIGVQERKINKDNYVVTRYVSENTAVSYISVMKSRDFFFRIRRTQIILLLSIAFLAFIGLIIAVYMSTRNYKPIRSLLKNITNESWDNKNLRESEFDFIMGKWNALSHTLDIQRPMVVYSCLSSLLRGEYKTREELDYYLKCANINLDYPWHFVLLLAPHNKNEFRSISSQIQMILSAVDKEVDRNIRLYHVELIMEQQVAIIANTAEKNIGDTEIRQFVAGILADRIYENFTLRVKAGIGRMYNNRFNINSSFMEATVVMEDYLPGKEEILVFEDLVRPHGENYQYPVIEQSLFIQSIKQGNKDMALKAIDEMVKKIAESESYPEGDPDLRSRRRSPVIQCLCFDVINMLIKTMGQLKGEIKISDIKGMLDFSDLEQFRQKIREQAVSICRKYQEVREQKNSLLKVQIIDYVNENFCQGQFSLQQVADNFEISPNYLSRFFKQETGCNFLQYVSMLRMDKVKELLVNTKKQVKEIVYDVGYMDTASFLRKFKNSEGITPGQYRDRMTKT